MSIFSNLSKKFGLTNEEVERIRQKSDADENISRDDLEQLARRLEAIHQDTTTQLSPEAATFYNKKDYKDPVTGAKRFGIAMQAKIKKLWEDVETLKIEIDALQSDLQGRLTSMAAPTPLLKEEDSSKAVAALKKTNIVTETIFEEVEKIEQLIARKEQEEQEALHSKAQEVRLRKEKEQSFRDMQKKQLQDLLKVLNSKERCTKRSVHEAITAVNAPVPLVLDSVFHLLKSQESSSSSSSSSSSPSSSSIEGNNNNNNNNNHRLRTALQTVLDILDRIIKRPDDINCRKIRISHPILSAKLASLPMNGLPLLLAVGFHASIAAAPPSDTAKPAVISSLSSSSPSRPLHTTGSSGGNSNGSGADASTGNAHDVPALLFALITPHTPYDLLLESIEPPVDLDLLSSSNNNNKGEKRKSAWLTWFDNLTVARDLVTECL